MLLLPAICALGTVLWMVACLWQRNCLCTYTVCINIMSIFESQEYDWVTLCWMRMPFFSAIATNSGCHTVSPTPSSLCVQLWFGALINCRGNVWDEGSQACIRKPPSPHVWRCSVWGIFTNLPHKALIYLGYGSLLASPSFYLSVCDETAQSPSSP